MATFTFGIGIKLTHIACFHLNQELTDTV